MYVESITRSISIFETDIIICPYEHNFERTIVRGWTGGAGVRGWRVRNRGWRVRNRGWRGREAGVEGAGSGERGAGSLERLGREIDFFLENSKTMAVLGL